MSRESFTGLRAIAPFLRAVKGRAYVRVVGASREISWMVSEIGIPLLAMSAYVLIYRAIGAPKVYESLVIVGSAMIPFWLTVLWSMAAQFYWEKEMGNLDLFMASPMSPMALLTGMAVGGAVMASLRVIGVLVLGVLIFNVPFELSKPLASISLIVLTLTALYSMGAMASSIYFLVGRAGIKLNLILMEPVFLLSGMYFPVKNLGIVLGLIASAIPLTLGLDGIRQCFLPQGEALGFFSVEVEIAALLVMTVLFSLLAAKLIHYMEGVGKRGGRLTLRWE